MSTSQRPAGPVRPDSSTRSMAAGGTVAERPRVAIVTLGCGRNEVDTDQVAGLLGDDYEVGSDATTADVVLVNTCTFIEPAKRESVDTILAAADLKDAGARDDGTAPACGVVVIGCMAQRYPTELSESLPEADAIVGFAGYPHLPGLVGDILAGRDHERVVGVEPTTAPSVLPGRALPVISVAPGSSDPDAVDGEASTAGDPPDVAVPGASWMARVPEAAGASTDDAVIDPLAVTPANTARAAATDAPPGHDGSLPTRQQAPASGPLFPPRRGTDAPWAYLKIASGCDRLCTFCAIPSFRGRFRSRGIDELVAEASWLADQGTRELVLVSENTTSWGKDLPAWRGHPGGRDLAPHLLTALADVDGIDRIRLVYLQPAELRPDLLEAIVSIDEVANYFDLSLQHVASPVLTRMARSGSPERFADLVGRIRDLAPDAAIRSNFILGFPGEDDAHVDQLADFLATQELDFVGLFTYSDEEGTGAVDLDGHVPTAVAEARRDRIADVVERASDRRAQRRIGDRLDVVVDHVDDGSTTGRSHREAPESDGEVQLVDAHGRPADLAIGARVQVTVTDCVGVDLVGTTIGTTG